MIDTRLAPGARAGARTVAQLAPAAVAAVALALAAAGCGGADSAAPLAQRTVLVPTRQATETQAPAQRPPPFGRLLVGVEHAAVLYARPGGRVLARIGPRTSFGSQTVLPVVRRRGDWYGVVSAALPNGRIGWVSADGPVRLYATDYRIDASLRRRQVVVRRGAQVLVRFPVAIGGAGTPTPTGRFAVTDTLLTEDPSGPYGCCIIALSGRQVHTPQGWGGGDRIAIHATDKPGTIGSAASLGCLRAPEDVMRRLIRLVPLGTLVTIRA